MDKLPQQEIDDARSDIVAVIESYAVTLRKSGPHEYKALCPFHTESSASFTVTPGKGLYHCFGCGAHGDSIDFVQNHTGAGFIEAVRLINGNATGTPLAPVPRVRGDEPETWQPAALVPADAPLTPDIKWMVAPEDWKPPRGVKSFTGDDGSLLVKHVASMRFPYLAADGSLIGYIVRFDLEWGGKEYVPQTWCVNLGTGEAGWKWKSFGKPRPLYGLDLLAKHPKAKILFVEGEKACDAGRVQVSALGFPPSKLLVISWPGGGKAIKHVDWSPVYGRSVAMLPDWDLKTYIDSHQLAGQLMPENEQPGFVAMAEIYNEIKDHCPVVKFVRPPPDSPDGWDIADPAPDGWDLKTALAKAKLAGGVFVAPVAPPEPPASHDTFNETQPVLPWENEPVTIKPEPIPTKQESVASKHDENEDPALTRNGYFRALGYDHGDYYILQYEKCQIMKYAKGDFSASGLIELAPLDWWEMHFPGPKGGINRDAAMNWLMRKCNSRGVYSMTRLRGRGAWTDKGRIVFHHGDYLTVDGVRTEIPDMDSHYVYEMAGALPEIPVAKLSDEEGRDLLELANMFRWARPASGVLLAGWCALAPIAGAIRWRPHVWITGGAGCGKTTILNSFVHYLQNGMNLYAQGNSTEAGVRQELKGDARPVLFDESESQTEREALRIQSVLAMVRQASSESAAKTYKGTAGGDAISFHIRSMFCLASIQVGIKYQADIERMTVLTLLPKRDDADPAETWKRIDDALHVMARDETMPGRLVRRSLALLPATISNIKTFAEAAAMKFGSQRDGDQYGTLMAGAWSLISRELVTLDEARQWIDAYDWSEHRENNETDEGERAMSALMGALVRISGAAEVTVSELVRTALGLVVDGVGLTTTSAEAVLQRHGIRTSGDVLLLSNTSTELRRLMRDTPFSADLRGVLLRVKGAYKWTGTARFSGTPTRCIAVPLDGYIDQEDEGVKF
jgi:putative DNA primase/helicase